MTDDILHIEVDGKPLEARRGQMLIEVTDANDIYIPRFCYHKKLSVAANCRMCLVEVEKAPKPLPACATPVMEGMKISTRSKLAIEAQKSVMEFLLINHPLDCPICDQGGECELQDLAVGYGLGFFSMVYSAGCMTFPDGLYVLRKYAQLYQDLLDEREYGALSVNGMVLGDVQERCADISAAKHSIKDD